MNDETKTKKTYVKKVDVEVISVKDKTSLVKYLDGDDLRKVYIPPTKLLEGKVEEPVWEKGVP